MSTNYKNNYRKFEFLTVFLISFAIFSSSALAKIVVINSENWEDVYAGIYYSQLNGYTPYFLNSPNPQGLFNILPRDKNILLIESEDKPFVSNLKTLLESKGYVVEVKKVRNGDIDLIPKQISNFVVVQKDFPYNAIVAAPIAKLNTAWVLIVDSHNINSVVNILKNANKVIAIGYFSRDVNNSISPYVDEWITSTNKFKLSTLVADKYLKIRPVSQVLISDGKYLENELLLGANPVLLVGENLLPDVVMDFMKTHNIKTAVLIGSHLTYVGERIRTLSDKKISVFIKFGEATSGVSHTIYALTMFPLYTKELKLNISSVVYDPIAKKLYVEFFNPSDSGLFEFTTLRLLDGNTEIASLSDREPMFIGANEKFVDSFDLVLPAELLNKNLTAEFYTSYGDSSDNLDKYITASGRFGPPLLLPLKIQKVTDNSNLKLVGVTYYSYYKRFGIKVSNVGNTDAYFTVKLIDVRIKGLKKSLSLDEARFVASGKEREVFIPAQLDELDLKDNPYVRVQVYYGEKEDLLVKSIDRKVELNIVNTNPITAMLATPIGLSVFSIVVGVIILLVLKKKRII